MIEFYENKHYNFFNRFYPGISGFCKYLLYQPERLRRDRGVRFWDLLPVDYQRPKGSDQQPHNTNHLRRRGDAGRVAGCLYGKIDKTVINGPISEREQDPDRRTDPRPYHPKGSDRGFN